MPTLPTVKQYTSRDGIRVYRIPCQVTSYMSGRVYLVLGAGPPTLVDTGSGSSESTGHLFDGLDTVRTQFGESVRIEDIRRILLTHRHYDHVGGLADVLQRTTAQVGIHPLDRRSLEARHERVAVGYANFSRFLLQAGVDDSRRKELCDAYFFSREETRGTAIDLSLEDGLVLDGLEFIHTPGHSPGHVCIRIGDILLSGDHILARTISQQWPESVVPNTGLRHYLDSLEKVGRIEGIKLILAGHEGPIEDVARRIEQIKASHQRRLGRLLDILGDAPSGLTTNEIAERMYARQKGFYAMLALTDVGARLEYLDQQGQLAIANLDEVVGQLNPVYRFVPA